LGVFLVWKTFFLLAVALLFDEKKIRRCGAQAVFRTLLWDPKHNVYGSRIFWRPVCLSENGTACAHTIILGDYKSFYLFSGLELCTHMD